MLIGMVIFVPLIFLLKAFPHISDSSMVYDTYGLNLVGFTT